MSNENDVSIPEVDAVDEKELSEARKIASDKPTYSHRFKKEFEWEGKKYSTLNFYWDRLTGEDMLNIEDEVLITRGKTVIVPAFSGEFLFGMAARASNLPVEAFMQMPLREISQIRNAARNFMMSAE